MGLREVPHHRLRPSRRLWNPDTTGLWESLNVYGQRFTALESERADILGKMARLDKSTWVLLLASCTSLQEGFKCQ